ncbi:MAG: hypothetical protein IT327_21990 [Anaerolineae bacterium]|nr:hypothetical protein [Anaerolineae bacterium]
MNFLHSPSLKKLRRMVTVLAAMIGFGLLSAGPAHASSSDFYFGKWFVTLAFPNNQPLVELTTEIWYKPANSAAYLVTAQTEALNCTVTGNLPVSSERATFTGQGYIACDQPDMVQKFYEVSQGALNNVPYDVPAKNPYVTGELVVAGNSANETQPAYYHPSLQYGLARTSATQAQQVLRVDGASSTSSSFVQVVPYSVRSEFQIQANGSYKTRFTANGVVSNGTPATLGAGLEVNLAATTIYFGYSPANGGSYFQGSIGTLTIDPGAFGRG